MSYYTIREHEYIRENIQNVPLKEIAKELKRTPLSVRNYAYKKGMKKTEPRKGQFQKGVPSDITKPEGTISLKTDHKGRKVQTIKVNGQWVYLARHNYRKDKGEIPRGYMLVFKDGDPMNCESSNLEVNHYKRINGTKGK